MSTPTPATSQLPHQPSVGSKYLSHAISYASHAVSTPNAHVSSTSTPRSVPSPALPRSAAKTPAATFSNVTRGKSTAGGTAMAPSLNQTSAGSAGSGAGLGIGGLGAGTMGLSPSANMLNFASPAALAALDMGTPSLLDPNGAIGGQAMNLTLSDLGLSSTMGRRNEDDERRTKLQGVLERLRSGSAQSNTHFQRTRTRHLPVGLGRVSEEGVCRAGRWAGFDVEVDTKFRAKDSEGQRPVTIAGKNAVLIDVCHGCCNASAVSPLAGTTTQFEFNNNVPSKIDVSFSSENEAVVVAQADAGKVLIDNLTPASGKFAHKIDRFAYNLEALAQLDKLSSNLVNCFDAITGVYTSLRRLYEHERGAARILTAAGADHHDRDVMRRRSGCPRLHFGKRVGLSLDYWAPKHSVASSVNGDLATEPDMDEVHTDTTFALDITAEINDSTLFPSLRVSSKWISHPIMKPAEVPTDATGLLSDGPVIDWLEPAQTYPPVDAVIIDGQLQQNSHEARFVARLRPPVVMPWNIAGQILQSVGATSMPSIEQPSSYEAMLLGHGRFQVNTGTGPAAMATKASLVVNAHGKEEVTQVTSLCVPKQEYAYMLEEIPFAHPRQLVEILPVLRQWACLGWLLKERFSGARSQPINTGQLAEKSPFPIGSADETPAPFSLESLLQVSSKVDVQPTTTTVPVDITLTTSPSPSLTLFFPYSTTHTAHLDLSILPNAEIVVTEQSLFESTKRSNGTNVDAMMGIVQNFASRSDEVAGAVDLWGDLGSWVEWIRMMARPGGAA